MSIGGFSHTSEGPKSPKSLLVRTWNNCIQKGLNHRIKMGLANGKPFSWLFCVQEHQEYELVQADNPDLNKADKCMEDSEVCSSS